MIFIYIIKNPTVQKINIGKNSLISRKNIKKITANINIIITAGEIVIVKGSLKNLK
jgi:hypothetical protein